MNAQVTRALAHLRAGNAQGVEDEFSVRFYEKHFGFEASREAGERKCPEFVNEMRTC